MNVEGFGGNRLKKFQLDKPGKTLLGAGPYEYYFYNAVDGEKVGFSGLRSFTLFVLEKPDDVFLNISGVSDKLNQGDRLQSENSPVTITVRGGTAKLLVAGTANAHPDKKGLHISNSSEHYRVSKPWGHEIWINGQHPYYALKEIFIKAGTKTSLQYHQLKQETNVLFNGTAKLHYKENSNISNDEVVPQDIGVTQINPICSVDIMPLTLHRLEAVTDILLYETSTPYLDDVVRVMDDSRRPDGRLETEHNN